MIKQIQAIRGMSDIVPEKTLIWLYLENVLANFARQYHYEQIRFPLVEKTALFSRTIGELTDIVEKEMYVFEDRNGESIALRPEGTAGCVRACLENALIQRSTQKLWYIGPMFRHERPQKGRYRQFHQFGLEAFGFEGPDIDAEMILFTYRLWCMLGLGDIVKLELNSLGSLEARQIYKKALIAYYQQHEASLDEDSKRRLLNNPLRILDSKNPEMKQLNEEAPKLRDYLDEESQSHFNALTDILTSCDIPYVLNSCLVRGLDYYSRTVFEWTTEALGAQGTICAGGRYDGLVEQLGGPATPAVGFAMGLERIITLLEQLQFSRHETSLDIFFIVLDKAYQATALALCEQIRQVRADISCYYQPGAASLKSQLKKADKSGARLAFIIGEEEFLQKAITVKFLRDSTLQQLCLPMDAVSTFIEKYKKESIYG